MIQFAGMIDKESRAAFDTWIVTKDGLGPEPVPSAEYRADPMKSYISPEQMLWLNLYSTAVEVRDAAVEWAREQAAVECGHAHTKAEALRCGRGLVADSTDAEFLAWIEEFVSIPEEIGIPLRTGTLGLSPESIKRLLRIARECCSTCEHGDCLVGEVP